jgi:hypothetical protein
MVDVEMQLDEGSKFVCRVGGFGKRFEIDDLEIVNDCFLDAVETVREDLILPASFRWLEFTLDLIVLVPHCSEEAQPCISS